MQKMAELIVKDNVVYVKGDINFANVMSLLQKSVTCFDEHAALSLDLSQVASSDSSGLALIIEWIKLARQKNKKIELRAIPADLKMIADVAGLDELLNT